MECEHVSLTPFWCLRISWCFGRPSKKKGNVSFSSLFREGLNTCFVAIFVRCISCDCYKSNRALWTLYSPLKTCFDTHDMLPSSLGHKIFMRWIFLCGRGRVTVVRFSPPLILQLSPRIKAFFLSRFTTFFSLSAVPETPSEVLPQAISSVLVRFCVKSW